MPNAGQMPMPHHATPYVHCLNMVLIPWSSVSGAWLGRLQNRTACQVSCPGSFWQWLCWTCPKSPVPNCFWLQWAVPVQICEKQCWPSIGSVLASMPNHVHLQQGGHESCMHSCNGCLCLNKAGSCSTSIQSTLLDGVIYHHLPKLPDT